MRDLIHEAVESEWGRAVFPPSRVWRLGGERSCPSHLVLGSRAAGCPQVCSAAGCQHSIWRLLQLPPPDRLYCQTFRPLHNAASPPVPLPACLATRPVFSRCWAGGSGWSKTTEMLGPRPCPSAQGMGQGLQAALMERVSVWPSCTQQGPTSALGTSLQPLTTTLGTPPGRNRR